MISQRGKVKCPIYSNSTTVLGDRDLSSILCLCHLFLFSVSFEGSFRRVFNSNMKNMSQDFRPLFCKLTSHTIWPTWSVVNNYPTGNSLLPQSSRKHIQIWCGAISSYNQYHYLTLKNNIALSESEYMYWSVVVLVPRNRPA